MLTVAIFISGRLTCYEYNLIPVLQHLSKRYDIHLFASINGVRDSYHEEAESRLGLWLKKICYENYNPPADFIQNIHPETLFQIVNDKKVPYTNLSCFYNDLMSFKLIEEYEKEADITYDVISKIRPDMIFRNYNDIHFIKDPTDKKVLHSCIPECEIYIYGWRHIPRCISDAFAYGNKETMRIYTNTYNYILRENKARNGNYRINYEPCVTESVMDFCILDSTNADEIRNNMINNKNGVEIVYFSAPYTHDKRRRDRDVVKNSHNP
jgi:hypothetical protein